MAARRTDCRLWPSSIVCAVTQTSNGANVGEADLGWPCLLFKKIAFITTVHFYFLQQKVYLAKENFENTKAPLQRRAKLAEKLSNTAVGANYVRPRTFTERPYGYVKIAPQKTKR